MMIRVSLKIKYLSFGSDDFHLCDVTSAMLFNARWRPDLVEEIKTKSSANNKRLILQFPIVANLLVWLRLSIQFT